MVSSRKRGRQEMEAVEPVEPPKERTLLEQIRNTWQFANLAQFIFTFGRVVKINENLDIEELEMECLKPHSAVLLDIGLALLKFVSSHRGLTPELFDEYTRRQYVARAPQRNPFGTDDEPAKFNDFDIFTKIRVLQQLTQWTMVNPDRIRERMEEQKDTEQTIWRIEPFGWDSEDRTYLVLDDNRLYRQTDAPEPPLPAPKPKKTSKKAKAAARASKRRRVSQIIESEAEPTDETDSGDYANTEKEDDGFGGMTWECLAVTLDELNAFVASIEKSRDPNEKILRKRIVDEVLPVLEKQEEARKRKAAQKERELLNLEKLASAKRSSRIAGKMEQQKQDEEAREAERKRQVELVMAKKEQEKWQRLEKERESRMMTREQRLKEREARRILHEEELANLSEDSKKLEAGAGRLSERHLKAEIEKKKQALEELAEEEDWIFDCICGAYGQIDDGTHSIACDKCNIWQHSKCVGVSQKEAERDDFHFICKTCERRARDAERAKTHPPIKIKLNRPGSASSSLQTKPTSIPAVTIPPLVNGGPSMFSNVPKTEQNGPGPSKPSAQSTPHGVPQMATWQPSPKPIVQNVADSSSPGSLPAINPPQGNGHQMSPQRHTHGSPTSSISTPMAGAEQRSTMGYSGPYTAHANSGSPPHVQFTTSRPPSAHAFSSPHPNSPTNLPPPGQSPAYSFINGKRPDSRARTPSQHNHAQHQTQNSPISTIYPHGTPISSHVLNGPRPVPSDGGHRRSSINLPSPLAGALILSEPNAGTSFPSSSPASHSTPNMHVWQPTKSSPPHPTSPSQLHDPEHFSALPPATMGLSPTKHSPPRPTTSNGGVGFATPSLLPPVASLSPSRQTQNLTPPVKSSEPERNRQNGQTASSQ